MAPDRPPGCLAFFLRLLRPATPILPSMPPVAVVTRVIALPVQPAAPAHPPPAGLPAENLAACRVRPNFMSRGEGEFFHALHQATEGRYVICPKVGLGDLFYVDVADEGWHTRRRFSQKHVDFLLCDPLDLKPVLGIELDDRSHRRPERMARDQVKNEVFAAAGLPLLRIPMRAAFTKTDIAAQIAGKLSEIPAPLQPASAPGPLEAAAAPGAPLCPRCGIPMVQKVAQRGPQPGGTFYGCRNYPACWQTRPLQ